MKSKLAVDQNDPLLSTTDIKKLENITLYIVKETKPSKMTTGVRALTVTLIDGWNFRFPGKIQTKVYDRGEEVYFTGPQREVYVVLNRLAKAGYLHQHLPTEDGKKGGVAYWEIAKELA